MSDRSQFDATERLGVWKVQGFQAGQAGKTFP